MLRQTAADGVRASSCGIALLNAFSPGADKHCMVVVGVVHVYVKIWFHEQDGGPDCFAEKVLNG